MSQTACTKKREPVVAVVAADRPAQMCLSLRRVRAGKLELVFAYSGAAEIQTVRRIIELAAGAARALAGEWHLDIATTLPSSDVPWPVIHALFPARQCTVF